MSLPKFFNNPYFQPKYQILHEKLNPVLKMLSEISQASQSFTILWEEDYQQLYDLESDAQMQLDVDCQLFKARFSKLSQEVIYVPNVRYHTLFQNIEFFSSYTADEQLLIFPLIDSNEKVKGIIGTIFPPLSGNEGFDTHIKQMESIGTYLNRLYLDYLDNQKSALPNYLNLENLPASFFEIELNDKCDLLYSNFSKTLIRKHPAFNIEHSAVKKVAKVLSMSIADFYTIISKIQGKQNIEYVYACLNSKAEKKYFLIKLHVSEIKSGQYRCLGVVEDFTIQKAYSSVLDQVIFDISHVMRRPVVTMKGLTNLIDMEKFEKDELREITAKIKVVSNEMEQYIRAMFKIYEAKQDAIYHL